MRLIDADTIFDGPIMLVSDKNWEDVVYGKRIREVPHDIRNL